MMPGAIRCAVGCFQAFGRITREPIVATGLSSRETSE